MTCDGQGSRPLEADNDGTISSLFLCGAEQTTRHIMIEVCPNRKFEGKMAKITRNWDEDDIGLLRYCSNECHGPCFLLLKSIDSFIVTCHIQWFIICCLVIVLIINLQLFNYHHQYTYYYKQIVI